MVSRSLWTGLQVKGWLPQHSVPDAVVILLVFLSVSKKVCMCLCVADVGRRDTGVPGFLSHISEASNVLLAASIPVSQAIFLL